MQPRPLMIASLLEYAERYHAATQVVSQTAEGIVYRYSYAEIGRRTRQLARALEKLGVRPGDRVATLAWNTHRHLELYYAISGIGAVCHTVNPRLFADQLTYIFNHAQDVVVFTDVTFVPLLEKLAEHLKTVRHYVVMTDRQHMPTRTVPMLCYEELVAAEPADYAWPAFDENTPSSLCYTSGTTGKPKGALYSHRSTCLHAMALCAGNVAGMSARDSVCPIVPMFHVNAWGVPYSAVMCGAKLVMPGPRLDGESVFNLFESEKVTISMGVPTIWMGVLKYLADSGHRFSTLKGLIIGGSAVPLSMIEALDRYGVQVLQGWGMTEMSPLGTVAQLKAKHLEGDPGMRLAIQATAGLCMYGVDYRLVDEEGREQPQDGEARGELQVRGHWVISEYYQDAEATAAAFEKEGWFHTGDIATIDPDGYLRIVDRVKDLIKSGGEWISSIDVENAILKHPSVAQAAVIAIPDSQWDERPLLVIVPHEGHNPAPEELLDFLRPSLAKWAVPQHVVYRKEMPLGATGKIYKLKLRELYRDYVPARK